MELKDEVKQALTLAIESRKQAYAPYSKFHVGAAVKLTGSDKLYGGFNIENSSYGATVCAERVAIFSALTNEKSRKLDFIVLVTDTDPVAPPCGMCLQVLTEFAENRDMPVYIANLSGIQKTCTMRDLLPEAFDPSHL